MTKPLKRERRAALMAVVRQPAPLSYDPRPRNRAQRRALARELQRLARRKGGAE
jgi:hypothetical protein